MRKESVENDANAGVPYEQVDTLSSCGCALSQRPDRYSLQNVILAIRTFGHSVALIFSSPGFAALSFEKGVQTLATHLGALMTYLLLPLIQLESEPTKAVLLARIQGLDIMLQEMCSLFTKEDREEYERARRQQEQDEPLHDAAVMVPETEVDRLLKLAQMTDVLKMHTTRHITDHKPKFRLAFLLLFVFAIVHSVLASLNAFSSRQSSPASLFKLVFVEGGWSGLLAALFIVLTQGAMIRRTYQEGGKAQIQKQLADLQTQVLDLSEQMKSTLDGVQQTQRKTSYQVARLHGMFSENYAEQRNALLMTEHSSREKIKKAKEKIKQHVIHCKQLLNTLKPQLAAATTPVDVSESLTQLERLLADPLRDFFALFDHLIEAETSHSTPGDLSQLSGNLRAELQQQVATQNESFSQALSVLASLSLRSSLVTVATKEAAAALKMSVETLNATLTDDLTNIIKTIIPMALKRIDLNVRASHFFEEQRTHLLSGFTSWVEKPSVRYQELIVEETARLSMSVP